MNFCVSDPIVPDNNPLLAQQLGQLSREIVDLLRSNPQCRMPFSKFIPSYHHHFGRQCRVADYGYTKLMELFEAIPRILQVGIFANHNCYGTDLLLGKTCLMIDCA